MQVQSCEKPYNQKLNAKKKKSCENLPRKQHKFSKKFQLKKSLNPFGQAGIAADGKPLPV